MNWISLLGLLAILGIAWGMSAHRKRVNLKTVAWGLGLQFLFALIILREDFLSFVGMMLLGGLVSVYILSPRSGTEAPEFPLASLAATLAGLGGLGALLYFALPGAIPWALGLLVVALLVNGRWRFAPGAQRYLSAGFIVLGVTLLISQGIHGKKIFEVASA